jgi:hypothetical protein
LVSSTETSRMPCLTWERTSLNVAMIYRQYLGFYVRGGLAADGHLYPD